MTNQLDTSRQDGLIPQRFVSGLKALLIGVGGIGSPAATLLAKLGVSHFTIYDMDQVNPENLAPGCFFPYSEKRGDAKTVSVAALIASLNSGASILRKDRYVFQREQCDIVIVSVDSLVERKLIAREHQIDWSMAWIDMRMGGTQAEARWVNKCDGPEYWQRYYDQLQALDETVAPCGEKATAFITNGVLTGWLGQNIYLLSNNQPVITSMFYNANFGGQVVHEYGERRLCTRVEPEVVNESEPELLTVQLTVSTPWPLRDYTLNTVQLPAGNLLSHPYAEVDFYRGTHTAANANISGVTFVQDFGVQLVQERDYTEGANSPF